MTIPCIEHQLNRLGTLAQIADQQEYLRAADHRRNVHDKRALITFST